MDVIVYGQLRAATGSNTVHLDGDVETVRDAIDRLLDDHPRARSHLFDDAGEIRPSVRVLVDGSSADLDSECPPDARLQLFPAMQGG